MHSPNKKYIFHDKNGSYHNLRTVKSVIRFKEIVKSDDLKTLDEINLNRVFENSNDKLLRGSSHNNKKLLLRTELRPFKCK